MALSRFITFRDKDSEGELRYYILQREFPHFVGIISNIPVPNALCFSPIPEYNMYIVFSGTLRGGFIPLYKDITFEVEKVFNDMASWYYEEIIKRDEKRYRKFKIITNGQQEKI